MKKKIYPDYEVIDRYKYFNEMEFLTFIRKKGDNGIWYLIPVRTKYYCDKSKSECMSIALKSFHNSCYRVLMLYKIHQEGSMIFPEYPWALCEERDTDQRDERFRLNRYLNINIKVV